MGMEDAWYFWNHCFLNRVKPPRKLIRKYYDRTEVKCYKCRNIIFKSDARRIVNSREYHCNECYSEYLKELRKEKYAKRKSRQREFSDELIKSISGFDDLMSDCDLKTCDILAAHHELLKNDPERLSTDFLIALVCGEKKFNEYKKSKNV